MHRKIKLKTGHGTSHHPGAELTIVHNEAAVASAGGSAITPEHAAENEAEYVEEHAAPAPTVVEPPPRAPELSVRSAVEDHGLRGHLEHALERMLDE
jgi:hypothetical protein